MYLGVRANAEYVHRVPWSANCWALNCIPKIFAVLFAWHCAPILPPKSAQVERINLGRPRPRFNPAQCSSQGTISYITQIMSSFWAGSSFSHSDWSPGCASIPANPQLRHLEESNRASMGLLRIKRDRDARKYRSHKAA